MYFWIVRNEGLVGKSNKKHSIAGADYLEKEELLDIEKYKEIYDMMYILRRRRKLIF